MAPVNSSTAIDIKLSLSPSHFYRIVVVGKIGGGRSIRYIHHLTYLFIYQTSRGVLLIK